MGVTLMPLGGDVTLLPMGGNGTLLSLGGVVTLLPLGGIVILLLPLEGVVALFPLGGVVTLLPLDEVVKLLPLVCTVSGGRPGHCPADHYLLPRKSHRLLQALHAGRYQYYDQEARETETGRVLVHGPVIVRDLDVYYIRVHRCQHRTFPGQPLQPL